MSCRLVNGSASFCFIVVTMLSRCDMIDRRSELSKKDFREFCTLYDIGPEWRPILSAKNQMMLDCPSGSIGLYTRFFDFANLCLPLNFLRKCA
ncbi:hypothetical protein R6Q59_031820 [Mikania micrantha]